MIDGDVARVRLRPARVGSGCLVALLGAGALVLWRTPSTAGDLGAVQPVAFLGVAVLAALVGGATAAALATVLGAAALAFGFTRPDHTLADASPAERDTFVVYVVVGLLACVVFVLADRRRRRMLRARAEVDRLVEAHRAESASRAVEAATRAAEAERRTRTALLASAADELRAPLAILRSATDMLRVAGDRLPDADRVELEQLVRETSGRLARMADDLRELGRLQAGLVRADVTAVDLDDVVRRASAGIAAKQVLVGRLPTVRGDAALLERALSNVLASASRYSDRVEILGEQRASRFELRVVDHGPGISAADWPRLFEPFRRLDDVPDSEGVGLSLAVVRGLVEAQAGTVRAEVTLGGGLTIVLDLPAG